MDYIFQKNNIAVRKMQNSETDYLLMTKWLSDPEVCEYYEGRNKPYDLNMVMEKFELRANGKDPEQVIQCIIEYNKNAIGFIQYYPTPSEELLEFQLKMVRSFSKPYGIDIVIGEPSCWNKGFGTKIIQMMLHYIFENEQADIVFITPMTWNIRAIRCYEKCGFTPIKVIEKRELHNGEYKDILVMVKYKMKLV